MVNCQKVWVHCNKRFITIKTFLVLQVLESKYAFLLSDLLHRVCDLLWGCVCVCACVSMCESISVSECKVSSKQVILTTSTPFTLETQGLKSPKLAGECTYPFGTRWTTKEQRESRRYIKIRIYLFSLKWQQWKDKWKILMLASGKWWGKGRESHRSWILLICIWHHVSILPNSKAKHDTICIL